MARTPDMTWDRPPEAWALLGQRLAYEIYALAGEHMTTPRSAEVQLTDFARAVDHAWRGSAPAELVERWVARRFPGVPVEVPADE